MKKKESVKKGRKPLADAGSPAKKGLTAVPWALIIQLVMTILSKILNKDQQKTMEGTLTTAANGYGGRPDDDKAVAARTLLRRAHDDTKRTRPFRRALLRWAENEVPQCCNMEKPALSAAQLSEAKPLAEHFD